MKYRIHNEWKIKKIFNVKPCNLVEEGKWAKGLRLRWLDGTGMDLRCLGVRRLRLKAFHRTEWAVVLGGGRLRTCTRYNTMEFNEMLF